MESANFLMHLNMGNFFFTADRTTFYYKLQTISANMTETTLACNAQPPALWVLFSAATSKEQCNIVVIVELMGESRSWIEPVFTTLKNY